MTIHERFEQYDRENPEIWRLFQEFTLQMIRAGRERYSARTVIHRIRWHTDLHAASADKFKINNIFSPFYARKFEQEFPEHAGFFEKRHSIADREAAHV